MRELYIPDTAEALVMNIEDAEQILGIHINRLKNWDLWERLVDNWLAFCREPKKYADTVVPEMIQLWLRDQT